MPQPDVSALCSLSGVQCWESLSFSCLCHDQTCVLVLFAPKACWIPRPSGILGFCPGQQSPGFSPITREIVWAGVLALLVPSSVCRSLDAQWVRLHLGPLVCGVRSHSSHQGAGTLFVDGYLICCLKKEGNKKEEHLMPPSC